MFSLKMFQRFPASFPSAPQRFSLYGCLFEAPNCLDKTTLIQKQKIVQSDLRSNLQ